MNQTALKSQSVRDRITLVDSLIFEVNGTPRPVAEITRTLIKHDRPGFRIIQIDRNVDLVRQIGTGRDILDDRLLAVRSGDAAHRLGIQHIFQIKRTTAGLQVAINAGVAVHNQRILSVAELDAALNVSPGRNHNPVVLRTLPVQESRGDFASDNGIRIGYDRTGNTQIQPGLETTHDTDGIIAVQDLQISGNVESSIVGIGQGLMNIHTGIDQITVTVYLGLGGDASGKRIRRKRIGVNACHIRGAPGILQIVADAVHGNVDIASEHTGIDGNRRSSDTGHGGIRQTDRLPI